MTARDRWSQKLTCPKCGKTGKVNLSQADGHAFLRGETEITVDAISDGFKAAGSGYRCTKCNVVAREGG
jgi:predicted RNA-binding Zn-ribbon protein involved in translation (DUF1610 family)